MDNQKPPSSGERPIHKIYTNKKPTCVYGLIDPRDGSLFWVGITTAPHLRYDEHVFESVKNNPGKQRLIDEIKASGHQPGMVLIDQFDARDQAKELEKNLIVFLSGVSSIRLTNIEHKPDKSWAFKTNLSAQRLGLPWDADQRIVLIGLYNKGVVCELIGKELQRTKKSIYFELYKAERAQFLVIRETDREAVKNAVQSSKFPIRDLNESEKGEISASLYKVGTRYGELNAAHIKQGFIIKKPDNKKQ